MNYPVRHPRDLGDGRSAVLRTEPLRVSALRAAAAIVGPSPAFVALTRNPELESPRRFEPTVKRDGDVVL